MKGAGRDCTLMFNKFHAWVNYEQFLQSCYIGPIQVIEPPQSEETPE